MQEIIRYQEIDAKLRKLENELASSANRKSAGEMQQYLKDGQARLLKLEEIAENLTAQYEKATKLYNDFVQKLDVLSKSIDAASDEVKISELEKTIENFSNTAENLENNLNVLLNKINAVNKEFEALMNKAKKAKHNLEIYKTNYTKEREQLEPKINELKNELEKQKSKVDASVLSKYNSKAESKLFPIYVAEINGSCGGCRMQISASRLSSLKDKGVIECENCGRFIYKK